MPERRRDQRPAHPDEHRAEQAGERIERRRAAGRAPGHVDDGRPGELVQRRSAPTRATAGACRSGAPRAYAAASAKPAPMVAKTTRRLNG